MACNGMQSIFLKAVALIALGTSVGLIDSMRRPIKLGGRITVVDINSVLGGGNTAAPNTPAGPPSTPPSTTTPKNSEPPPQPAAHSTTTPPAASAADIKPGDPGWQPTPADKLPKGQITLDAAKRAFDAGANFVDARRKEEYEAGHVQGAMRMNLQSFANGNPPLMAMLARDAVVVVYCGGGHCDESERVAEQLNNSGYSKVFIIHDGYPGWKAMNWPVETGEGLQ